MEGFMTTVSLGGSAPASFGRFRNAIEVFDIIRGTRQLTIPNGWSRIRVAVVGGGAGGRNVSSAARGHGGGGGGGGYAEIELDVVPGQTYTYTVGAGGDLNQDGSTTSFGALLSATGGKTATDNTTSASKGGAGGVGIGGTITKAGGAGGNGFDGSNGGGGGGGASGSRYGVGGAGGNGEAYLSNGTLGGVGGSWEGYPRPLLYDDGWGLGITPHDLPLDADLTLAALPASYYLSVYSRVGQGTSNSAHQANLGGGSCANRGNTSSVQRGGIGGGGGGGYSTYTGRGGPGAVIVEVLG
ncbi:glycine-rich domain-containing protein [Aeromonas hydrophila]|uniref:glycine-rich domain-containing protein n=1 Tax=Aeromonas hydrophila TaxID=644 RepID=UPI0030CC8CDC